MFDEWEPFEEIACVICDGSGFVDFPVFDGSPADRTCPYCGVIHNYACRYDDRYKNDKGETFYPIG
jgi:hypothetical protein